MISTELFQHQNHPYRLEFGEKKNITVCYFSCQEHLDKYLERYKLDKRTIKIDYRYGKPTESGENSRTTYRKDLERPVTEVLVEVSGAPKSWIPLELLVALVNLN